MQRKQGDLTSTWGRLLGSLVASVGVITMASGIVLAEPAADKAPEKTKAAHGHGGHGHGEHGHAKSNAKEEVENVESPYPQLPEPVASFGGTSADGWVYVYSGHTGKTHDHSTKNLSKSFIRMNINNPSEWEQLPMGVAIQGFPLVTYKGDIYRIGGMTALNENTDDAENMKSIDEFAKFDPKTKTWTQLAPLPEGRSSHDAVVVGDKIYVFGGWWLDGEAENKWFDDSLVIDMSAKEPKWEKIPQPFHRRAVGAVYRDGKFYVMGGIDPDGELHLDTNVYDPKTNTWSEGPELPGNKLNGFGVSTINWNGDAYFSGIDGKLCKMSKDGSKWDEVADVQVGRMYHRLIPASDSKLLVVAGTSRKAHRKDVEVIDLTKPQTSDRSQLQNTKAEATSAN